MKTFYILSIAIATVASAGSALANSKHNRDNIDTTPLTGPYIGVYSGYDRTNAHFNGADPEGWDGGVFVGYKMDALFGGGKKDYGIGANGALEAFLGASNADHFAGGTSLEKNNEWGVSFRPGLSVVDRMMGDTGMNSYGILGYRNTEFKVSGSSGGSDRFDGFELGLGAQLIRAGAAGLRLEYAHTWYGEEQGIHPESDDIRLGVSYHF